MSASRPKPDSAGQAACARAEDGAAGTSSEEAVQRREPHSKASISAEAATTTAKVVKKRRKELDAQLRPSVWKKPKPAATPVAIAEVAVPSKTADPIFGQQWSALEPIRLTATARSHDGAAVAAFRPTPQVNWWGARQFTSAGQLEGLERKPAASADKQGFNEDDQAQLYMRLQDAKTSGKGGLGKNAAPEKGLSLAASCPISIVLSVSLFVPLLLVIKWIHILLLVHNWNPMRSHDLAIFNFPYAEHAWHTLWYAISPASCGLRWGRYNPLLAICTVHPHSCHCLLRRCVAQVKV